MMPANLKRRTITSVVLIAAIIAILIGDQFFQPFTPFLALCLVASAIVSVGEFQILIISFKPRQYWLLGCVLAMICIPWLALCFAGKNGKMDISDGPVFWTFIGIVYMIVSAASVLNEIINYDSGNNAVARIASTLLGVVYLGVLPCFLLKLCWLPPHLRIEPSLALAATIFVPKLGDVGAYLTGSLIGRNAMTPTLSPKKTWEGLAGGLIVSMLTAVAINSLGREPLFKNGVLEALAFGFAVGLAGVFGDLFESMLKRDAQTKDASQTVPGFGGALDVVDSVLFAAPVAYLFLIW